MRTREQIIAKITLGLARKGKLTGVEKKLARSIKRKDFKKAVSKGIEIYEVDSCLSRVDSIAEIDEVISSLRFLSGSEAELEKSKDLRLENDLFRFFLDLTKGKILLTGGIANHEQKKEILERVSSYKDFKDKNDPYGEHDFALIRINRVTTVFFKIDYYDLSYEYGADPYTEPFKRVLTIGLDNER